MHNGFYIIQHGYSSYMRLNIKAYKLKTLYYISFPGCSIECFLEMEWSMSREDEQMLKIFIAAIR